MEGKWLWGGASLWSLHGLAYFLQGWGSKGKSVRERKGLLTGTRDCVCVDSLQAGRNRCLRIPRSRMKGLPCTLECTRSHFSLMPLLRNLQKMIQTLSPLLRHPAAWTPGVPAGSWSKPSAKERAGAWSSPPRRWGRSSPTQKTTRPRRCPAPSPRGRWRRVSGPWATG